MRTTWLLFLALFAALALPAHAYLDPASGSMILQVVLGGIAGLAVAVKLYWHKLLAFFGARNEELVFDVPREQFDFEPEAGQVLQAEGPGGATAAVRVVAVSGDKVTLDGNHPLAGQALTFDIEIVDVRAASAEELSHGHSHGPGGHHH